MTFEWWFAYLLTSTLLSLSPGSGAINTMTTSINHGYRGAAASIAGLQTGLGIHIVLVGVGLGTLFSRSLLAFEILKWAGAAYLIWLGIQQWRAAGAIDLHTRPDAIAGSAVQTGDICQSNQSQKYCLSCRPVSAIHHAAATATGAVPHSRRHHDCGGYDCDDRLRHTGAAHCRLD